MDQRSGRSKKKMRTTSTSFPKHLTSLTVRPLSPGHNHHRTNISWLMQLVVFFFGLIFSTDGFQILEQSRAPVSRGRSPSSRVGRIRIIQLSTGSSSTAHDEESSVASCPPSVTPSYWKPKGEGKSWKERKQLRDLRFGQKLSGHVVAELLDGRTGPKVFIECGVGTCNRKGNWSIVNGMLRLNREKKSVTKKRSQRLRKQDQIEVYVSRIQAGCGRLEVVKDPEDLKKYKKEKKRRVSSLKPGEEVVGTVLKLLPYGAMVDIGTNRPGLLHIQKVADLYQRFINKEKGIEEAGLERGAKIRLVVESVQQRKVSLDFTSDVKKEAAEEAEREAQKASDQADVQPPHNMSADDLAEWASFGAQEGTDDNDLPEQSSPLSSLSEQEEREEYEYDEDDYYDDEDDDDYDEDRDIEDALGLGSY